MGRRSPWTPAEVAMQAEAPRLPKQCRDPQKLHQRCARHPQSGYTTIRGIVTSEATKPPELTRVRDLLGCSGRRWMTTPGVRQCVVDPPPSSVNIRYMSLPTLHTLEEVAEYLHLKPKSLREFCREKGIALIKGDKKTFLLTRDDIDSIIALRRQSCSS